MLISGRSEDSDLLTCRLVIVPINYMWSDTSVEFLVSKKKKKYLEEVHLK
jgi:hypothetical protein